MLPETTTISTACRHCGTLHDIDAPTRGWIDWQEGELIQVALPTLTEGERELLISGTCDTCWDRMFPPENDEND